MTEYIEFEGKTIEKALEQAAKELETGLESIQYDVVSHGSTGIFGLVGAKKAKIRVKVDGNNGHKGSHQIQQEAKERARDLVKDAFQIDDETVSVNYEKAIEVGTAVLQRLTDAISEGSSIEAKPKKESLVFNISSGNSGLLIGKRGQTLEAMQYLVEKIINKQTEQRIRVLVDVEGYLDARKSNLKKMASRMADKVKKINKPVTMGQMNAYDRRIVHLHLKENPAVRTQSMGEGYYRKLIIFPKKMGKNRKSQG